MAQAAPAFPVLDGDGRGGGAGMGAGWGVDGSGPPLAAAIGRDQK